MNYKNTLLHWQFDIMLFHLLDRDKKAEVEVVVDVQAEKSAEKVLTDVVAGKDVHKALIER